MIAVPDLHVSEIKETAFSLCKKFFPETTKATSCSVLFSTRECGWKSGPITRLFLLGLGLDCECSSEVPLSTMVVPVIPKLSELLWYVPLELPSKPVLWRRKGEKAYPLRFLQGSRKKYVPLLNGSGFQAKYAGAWSDILEAKRSK